MARMRFDLDGIPLDDEEGRTTAFLRFRTTAGLVVGLPESVDVTVPWGDLAEASADLVRGRVVVRFSDEGGARHAWLGRARSLTGRWIDREVLTEAPKGRER
jgi:hypothetical protein